MKENQHTPGPWSIHEYSHDGIEVPSKGDSRNIFWHFGIGAGKTLLGKCEGQNYEGGFGKVSTREETLANARLMTAAPEMFELMERIVSKDPPIQPYELRIAARRIVKKVNGED